MRSILTLQKWLYEKLCENIRILVYNTPPDILSYPNISIEHIGGQPWLIKPKSDKITFIITINSLLNSNSEVLSLAEKVKQIISEQQLEGVIIQEIDDFKIFREGKYWKCSIELNYYILHTEIL